MFEMLYGWEGDFRDEAFFASDGMAFQDFLTLACEEIIEQTFVF